MRKVRISRPAHKYLLHKARMHRCMIRRIRRDGHLIDALFDKVFSLAKRPRSETEIVALEEGRG